MSVMTVRDEEPVVDGTLRRFGQWLEYRREELGMTQDELAEKMGNISSFVSELELSDVASLTENESKQLILGLDISAHKLLEAPGVQIVEEKHKVWSDSDQM